MMEVIAMRIISKDDDDSDDVDRGDSDRHDDVLTMDH